MAAKSYLDIQNADGNNSLSEDLAFQTQRKEELKTTHKSGIKKRNNLAKQCASITSKPLLHTKFLQRREGVDFTADRFMEEINEGMAKLNRVSRTLSKNYESR